MRSTWRSVWRACGTVRPLSAELDRYDAQRRGITMEYVQTHSIANKRNLEARDPAEQDRFRDEMRAITANPGRAHAYLERVSMIASLKRAAELG